MDQGAADSSPPSSGSSSSINTEELNFERAHFMDGIWQVCSTALGMLLTRRADLMRILHPAWAGGGHPPEVAVLNNLFLEPITALQQLMRALGTLRLEEMTVDWIEDTVMELQSLKDLVQETWLELGLLIDWLQGLHPVAARNLIRLLLRRNW